MPHVSTEAGQLFYARHRAEGARYHLILLHGAGGSRLVWSSELRRIPGTEAFVLDLPGHGRSSPPGRDSIEAYASVVCDFIDALDLENVVLVGHSMGGAIAQAIAVRFHASVCAMVLLGTGARLRVTDKILGRILTDFEETVSLIVSYSWAAEVPQEVLAGDRRRILTTPPEVLYGDYKACDRFDLMRELDQIQIPTLVISGANDVMTPAKYGQYLANNIPRARFTVIEGAGHNMMLEQPKRVAREITSFLDELSETSH